MIEKAKEEFLNNYCEFYLETDMVEKAKKLLKKYFSKNSNFNNVYYSLDYCQGDGAMIEFDLNYYNKIISVKHNGHYYHEYSYILDYYNYLGDKREQILNEKIVAMNKELTNYGYFLIENCVNQSFILEELKQNNYLKDGTIF